MKIPRKIFKKEKNILNKWGKNWFIPVAAILVAAIALAGCSAPSSGPATPAKSINLTGAGATFPAPLYTKWFDEYNKLTGVKVNYQPIGSGGGISQITEGTVDFGASDGIMTEAQVAKAEQKGGPILHVPMTSGAVAVIYNLAGIGPGQLKLTGDVLADIYLKKITKWNDSAIASLNPDLKLPDAPIAVVFRSDGSGTTYIFTNYLSKISQDWSSRVGNATSVKWPGDIGGQGNAGVAGQVQQIPNSIGYVELAYAEQNKLAWAKLKNAAGNFIEPSPEATTRAAEGVSLPDDMRVMLTNSANPEAYPIVGFTWILVYVNQKDKDKGEALTKMLWWAIHDGQQFTGPLTYASLAAPAVLKAENAILSIKYQGQPLITR
jgi:phosphate transport system substrate-binding protein